MNASVFISNKKEQSFSKSSEQVSLTEQYQELTTTKHMLDEMMHENNTTQTAIEEINKILEEKCNENKVISEKIKQLLEQISDIKRNQATLLQRKQDKLLFIKKQADQKSEVNQFFFI